MNRNVLYGIIAVLAVMVLVSGYYLYQENQSTSRVEINVGEGGLTVETD